MWLSGGVLPWGGSRRRSMAIQIITDSAADYTVAEIQKNNFLCVPMSINFGKETYADGVDITRDEFYERLEKGEYPTTSQPSPAAFLKLFEEAKKAGDEVIAILISGELSGTCQGAELAKQMVDYEKIYIIDSRHATVSMRILVNHAIRMRREGCSAKEIVEAVEALRDRVTLFAGLNTLEYLAKGGRLSKGQANLGNLVNLKPLITFSDGKVVVCGKQIGSRRAFKQIAKLVQADMPDPDYPVYFLYTYDKTNCLGFVATLKNMGMDFGRPRLRGVGATIGTHIGAGAFGIVYVKKA